MKMNIGVILIRIMWTLHNDCPISFTVLTLAVKSEKRLCMLGEVAEKTIIMLHIQIEII